MHGSNAAEDVWNGVGGWVRDANAAEDVWNGVSGWVQDAGVGSTEYRELPAAKLKRNAEGWQAAAARCAAAPALSHCPQKTEDAGKRHMNEGIDMIER
jgi:hypothetical protein